MAFVGLMTVGPRVMPAITVNTEIVHSQELIKVSQHSVSVGLLEVVVVPPDMIAVAMPDHVGIPTDTVAIADNDVASVSETHNHEKN